MRAIWRNLAHGWNFIKIIRVAAGVFVLSSGINDNNSAFILLGAGFLLISLFAPGACCVSPVPPYPQQKSSIPDDIEYEELDVK